MYKKRIIKIGVLGCASIARRSMIPAILQLPELFSLAAVASRDRGKADSFAGEFGCRAVGGYEELINLPDVDALYVPLPTGLHQEWVNKALRAGKHVYAEKSMAMCLADAKEMVANARQYRLALMEGFMFQYHAQHRVVLNLIKNGEIGEVRHFCSFFGFPPLPESNFRYDDRVGGGALMDAAGYTLRAAHFIIGDTLVVKGATLHYDPVVKCNTWGSAFLADSNGLGASLAFGFDNHYQCRYEIWGSKGKITSERAFTPPADCSPRIQLESASRSETIHSTPDNHFIKSLVEFHRIIGDYQGQEKHYAEILLQSDSLDSIRAHAGF